MSQILEILGVVTGIIYLWLEYKASIHLWIVSIIMPLIYLVVYHDAGLYADMAINIYYLIIALYGWLSWKYTNILKVFNKRVKQRLYITHTTSKQWFAIIATFIMCHIGISLFLLNFTDSDVPWFNGLTSALSIVGMWMLARKLIEQWIVWIVVDVLSAMLYMYKDLKLTSILYIVYAIVAIFGYIKWKKLMIEQNAHKKI